MMIPLVNKNIQKCLKNRDDSTPMVYLSITKKRRVFEAIDDGLSKYLPKKKVKNFSMLIQMVEKLMDSKETKKAILEKLDPPRGKRYKEEMRREAREKRKLKMEEKLKSLRTSDKDEIEKKVGENNAKEVFLDRKGSNIEIEEVAIGNEEKEESCEPTQPTQISQYPTTAKSRFHPVPNSQPRPVPKTPFQTNPQFPLPTSKNPSKYNFSTERPNLPTYQRSGVYTPGHNITQIHHFNPKNRACTSLDTKRQPPFPRDVTTKSSYRSPPFDKTKFIQELQEKEDRKMKQSTRDILEKKQKLEKELLGYKVKRDGAIRKNDKAVEEIQRDNKKMREAIEAYVDLMEIGESDDITLQDVINEHQDTKLSAKEINSFKGENRIISLFLKKQGRRKIWKPDRFAASRRVKIAESFDQLIG